MTTRSKWIIPVAAVAVTLAGCKKKEIEEQCCKNEYTITTQNYVLPEDFTLFIPQAFTPNGDGINDQFRPLGNGWRVESMVVKRGNKTLYQSTDHLDAFWSGGDAKDGKYTYEFTFRVLANGDRFDVAGDVCLFHYGARGESLAELEEVKVCDCVLANMIDPVDGPVKKNTECAANGQ